MKVRQVHEAWPIVLGGALVFMCVAIGFYLSYRQALQLLEFRTGLLVEEVLERSHTIRDRVDDAIRALQLRSEESPCSERSQTLMRELVLSGGYLQLVGHVQGDHLGCSSYGVHSPGLPIGAPAYRSPAGMDIRPQIRLEIAGEGGFLAVTHPGSGYTAIARPDQALHLRAQQEGVALGLYSPQNRVLISGRGAFEPAWLAVKLDAGGRARYMDGRWLWIGQRSPRYGYAVYAALPVSELRSDFLRYSLVLVPLGLIAGLACFTFLFLHLRRQQSMAYRLSLALRRKELFLHYQPIVGLASGRWIGAEALLRWRDQSGNMVPPDLFIGVAERNGLIGQVTRYVIDALERDVPDLLRADPDFHVGFNLSSQDLDQPGVLERLERLVHHTCIQPRQIFVEVTERLLVEGQRVRRRIDDLRQAGFSVAIDDFGTGYSGLSYLTMLEVDCIKIDKSFVETIGTDAVTSQVISHIIEIGKSLRLQMIAEGVETQAQADYLRAQGVSMAQGWLFAKAMPLGELTAELQRRRAQVPMQAPGP